MSTLLRRCARTLQTGPRAVNSDRQWAMGQTHRR